MGGLTGKPGTRAKTNGEATGMTRLRRDCRGSLPISPAATPLVLARLSRPPKPPATQAISGLWFLNYVELFFFQYKNLEKPYSTNCTMKTLNTYSTYTSEGCADECEAEGIVKLCGCRPVGYKGTFLSFLRLFSINAIVIPAASTRICRIQIN